MAEEINISDELLAAYAEGNVSNDERMAVRQYLMDNPDELESVMMMMDDDYDIVLDDEMVPSASSALLGERLDALYGELKSSEKQKSCNLLKVTGFTLFCYSVLVLHF